MTAADMNTHAREPLTVYRPPKFEVKFELKNPDPALLPLLFGGIPVHESPLVPKGQVIAVNVHGTALSEKDLAESVRKHFLFSQRYGRSRKMAQDIDSWVSGGLFRAAPLPTRRDKIKREITKQRKLLRLLDRFGDEDPFKDEAVLAIDIRFPDRDTTYHYAAVRAVGEWYLTGCSRNNEGPYSWEGLILDFLARGEEVHVYFANSMTEIGG